MAWAVVSFLFPWISVNDPKATIIMGSTSLTQYSNVSTNFWMRVFSFFGFRGDMSSSCANFFLVPYLGHTNL